MSEHLASWALLLFGRGLPEAQGDVDTWDGGWFLGLNSISHLFSFFPHYWVVGEKLQGAALLQ